MIIVGIRRKANETLTTPTLALLIPSAHAVDYVKCEAIRAVISRNEIQKSDASENSISKFRAKKIREKYGKGYCQYGSATYNECNNFKETVFSNFEDEYEVYVKAVIDPYIEINSRAVKDFEKNGCYWF